MEWLVKVMTVTGSVILLVAAFGCLLAIWTWLGDIGSKKPVVDEDQHGLMDDLDDCDESTRREIKRLKRRLRKLERALEEHDTY